MRAFEFNKLTEQRLPDGGDCFESALQELMHSNPFGKDHMDNMTMVHAIVSGQGEIEDVKHGHAWNEIGDVVLDKSNGRNIVMRKEQYYKAGNIDPNNTNEFKRYTRQEMAKMVSKFKTYGPWELPNDLVEYRGARTFKYRDGGKPDWYDKAVQLKKDNPHITASEIGRQLKKHPATILSWLAGVPDSHGNIVNDNPLFTSKDFPQDGKRKYFDGAKPWWYEEAIALRKQGITWKAISNKLSTPEKKVMWNTVQAWLVKGKKQQVGGNLLNKDAPFEPRPYNTKKIDTAEIEELILAKIDDADIIKYIQDHKGTKEAIQVRAMLPQLRQKLNPGTSVIDKTRTGNMKDPDITGFVQETSQTN